MERPRAPDESLLLRLRLLLCLLLRLLEGAAAAGIFVPGHLHELRRRRRFERRSAGDCSGTGRVGRERQGSQTGCFKECTAHKRFHDCTYMSFSDGWRIPPSDLSPVATNTSCNMTT